MANQSNLTDRKSKNYMTVNEKYLFLFIDTFYGNLILSIQDDFAFKAMNIFGHNGLTTWTITLFAVLLAGLGNYLFGYVLYNIFIKHASDATKTQYLQIGAVWSKFHIIALCFCIMPIMAKLLILLCGFIRFRLLRCLMILTACKYAYYFSQITFV